MTLEEDIRQRCFEARCAANWWAAECKEIKTEKEIIDEANKRYNSFFERDHFIRSAEEIFCLIQHRKKTRIMITEDYVSFETAKLLKEKGFDRTCKVWYAEYISMWGGDPSGDRKYINIQFDDKNRFDVNYKFLCYAPTLQMAIKWLRKEHNLAISTSITIDGWHSGVSQIKLDSEGFVVDIIDGIDGGNIPNCETYEEACEAAIQYCLENLI